MKTLEEAALIAALESDDDEVGRLIESMLPNERLALRAAALKLAALAGGLPVLPDAMCHTN